MTLKNISVLIVEDDEDYASLLARWLGTSSKRASLTSYTVAHTPVLDQAAAYISQNSVDIILLDLKLPGTTGLDTLKRMHSVAPATAIIILTSSDDELLTAQALQAGAEDYLIKGQFNTDTLLRSIGYAIDRKQSRNALLASERRFRSLIENATDAVIIVDSALALTYASPSIRTLLAYAPAETIGRNLLDFIHPYDVVMLKIAFATAQEASGFGIHAGNLRAQHADGSWRVLNAIITDLLADSTIQGMVVNARDVTEQQQAEAVMRKAQKLESVGLLASGIAHDFNNLLTNILAQNALAIAKLPTDSPVRAHIGKVNNAVGLAVSLTRQLLAYAGKEYVQVEAVHLNVFLQKNLPLLHAALAQSIDLQLNLMPELPTIDADVSQLQQVMMNLVINAAEAIYPNAGQIIIATIVVEFSQLDLKEYLEGNYLRAGHYVVLEVKDTGRGMNAATRARIFEPFFSTKPHGNGLGLPATLGILHAHRVALRVQSEPGLGTQFRLLFPIGKLQPQAATDTAELAETTTATVLLIEDEKLLLESLADLLGAAGLQTLTALHGKQGIDLFKQYHAKIGVVVLDMKMPVMEGAETLRQLREFDPEIEVIIISAYTIPADVQKLIDNQKITLITKPFDIDDLLSKIINTVVRHP